MTKSELRAAMRRRYLSTTAAQRAAWGQALCAALLRDEHILSARCILAFYPLADEVDIRPLLAALRAAGKTVLLPEVVSAETMTMREYDGTTESEKGMYGTVNATGEEFTAYEAIDVVLVPGVAFTRAGARLGRGKGFYDRHLERLPAAYKRGVCFPYQIVESIPCEAHDIQMDYV